MRLLDVVARAVGVRGVEAEFRHREISSSY